MKKNIPAAANLEKLSVGTGWLVTERIVREADATGGQFSYAYVVTKDGRRGFLKALDFSHAFQSNDVVSTLQRLTTAFTYERDLLFICREKRLSKVVVALEHGEVQVPEYDEMGGAYTF